MPFSVISALSVLSAVNKYQQLFALHICIISAITEPTIINAINMPIIALCHRPLLFFFFTTLFFFTIFSFYSSLPTYIFRSYLLWIKTV